MYDLLHRIEGYCQPVWWVSGLTLSIEIERQVRWLKYNKLIMKNPLAK